ncbi:tripartite motif-containing protein 3-like [Ptychodera flava]|uniref:tripartite motif-containing protein 3-like n=1 Tax=Ptychodera flava TaxID=63121 RepID=UPI00396A2560
MAEITRICSQTSPCKSGEGFLSCPICFERYKKPKILPCHHTFCEKCLTTFVGKETEMICPTCYTPCPLSADGVKHLKSSYFISSLLDIVCQETPGRDEVPGVCEGCEENAASHRCLDCGLDFCQACTKPHKTVPATKNHKIVTNEEYQEAKSLNIRIDSTLYCSSHPEDVVKFYCDTCQVPVCLECIVIEHRVPKCSHRKLQEAADDSVKTLRDMLTKLKVKEARCDVSKYVAGDNRDKLRKHCHEEEQNIRGSADKIARMIRREQDRLIEELKTDYDTKLKTAETQINELEFKLGNISSLCSHIETVMQLGSATQLLSSKGEIVNRIEKLTMAKRTALTPLDTVKFKATCDIGECSMLGMLQSKVSVQHCLIESTPKQLFTGGSVDLIIKTRDSTGKLVIPDEEITVKLEKRMGLLEELNVLNNENGTHTVTIHGRMEGTYRVTVTIAGEPVPGAPFDILITKGFVREIGTKGKDKCQFDGPMGIAINRVGDFVTCDKDNNRVQIIDIDGNFKSAFTFTSFERPIEPCCIAISKDDEYLITDISNNRVVVSDENGQFYQFFGHAELKYPHGIAISPLDDTVYVTDWDAKVAGTDKADSHCVRKFTKDGQYIRSFGKYGTKRGHFRGPAYLAINSQGMAFVSDYSNNRIWVISEDCEFLCLIGSYGREDVHVRGPLGVAIDWKGYLYISEVTNKRVQKFTSNGIFVSRIDGEKDGLRSPHGIALTNNIPCRVVVADHDNDCIKVFAQ